MSPRTSRIRIRSAQEIRPAREQLGLSQEKAAYLLDVALATYSRWERGIVNPSKLVLRGIEGFFEDYRKSQRRKGGRN